MEMEPNRLRQAQRRCSRGLSTKTAVDEPDFLLLCLHDIYLHAL